MAHIPDRLRQQVIERAHGRCEYCQTQQVIVVASENGLWLIGLTAIGRATIARLRINREAMVNSRRRWVMAGWHPPQDKN